MPRAPYGTDIYRQGQQVQTAAGGNDPTVSISRGVSIENLAGLVDIPMLDPRGPMAIGRGYAALGEGIQQVGGDMLKLLEMEARSRITTQVTNAGSELAALSTKMEEAETLERDQTKWPAIHEKIVGELSELPDDLSPLAREQIGALRDKWKLETWDRMVRKKAGKTIRDADSDMDARRRYYNKFRMTKEADAVTDMMGENGARQPWEVELLKLENREEAKRGEQQRRAGILDIHKNRVMEMASASPLADVRAAIADTPDLKPEERLYLNNAADAVARDATASLAQRVADGVVTGQIWNEYALDATVGTSPQMTPALREEFLEQIGKWDARAAEKDREENGVENAVMYRRKVAEYNPEADPERRQYFRLLHEIGARVVQSDQGEITGTLYRKYGATVPKLTIRPEIQRMVSRSLDATYDKQLRGYKAAVSFQEKADPEGNSDAAKKAQTDLDRRKQETIRNQAIVEAKMRRFWMENTSASDDATWKALQSFVPEADRIGDLDEMDSPPSVILDEPLGSGDPAGAVNDLPDGTGPSTPLIPDYYQGPQ